MDVRCTRCHTPYQLDETLISERGTTVECTHCGYQFRVQRAQAEVVPPEVDAARSLAPKSRARDIAHDDTLRQLTSPSSHEGSPGARRGSGIDEQSTRTPEPYLAAPYSGGVAARYGGLHDSLVDVESGPHSHRGVGSRWIFALVVLGGLGLLAGTVGRRYLERFVAHEAVEARDPDRLQAMLQQGEQLFFADDLEGAKAEFDKATVLAENDPTALAFLARIETVQADMIWLRLRLENDKGQVLQLRQSLAARLEKLDRAMIAALRVAKDNAEVLRAEVDALRLSGKLSEARALAPTLSGTTEEPETDYVLAALDLADESPSWIGVIERLRPAAAIEHGFGRARAALAYALINAERFADARAELDKVKPDTSQLALFTAVESYLGGRDRVRFAALPAPASHPVTVAAPAQVDSVKAEPVAVDVGKQVRGEAVRARAKGDIEAAERLYQQVLASNPSDIDALTNLGELAAQRRDFTSAMQYFEKVESINSSYVPALTGIADIQWVNGGKSRAAVLYQRVLDSTGASSSYGAHARIRLDEYHRAKATSSDSPSAPASSEAPKEEAPAIDAEDLPEQYQ